MTKLIGTDSNQVPSNADLGTSAYKDIKDFLLSKGSNLSAIDTLITPNGGITHDCVFVYDTTLDSDGGAWRKKTNNTSWYNETLNTQYRGARKEFPQVAIIIGELNLLTIYDGDDPDLPMWMKFELGDNRMINSSTRGIAAANGQMWVAHHNWGVSEVRFIQDESWRHRNNVNSIYYGRFLAPISERSIDGFFSKRDYLRPTVNGINRDIAMTVLPNAPIDPDTGLPLPTVAVATSSGVSVFRDDRQVIQLMSGTNSYGVAFTKKGEIIHTTNDASSTFTHHVRQLPSVDDDVAPTRRYYFAGNYTHTVPAISGACSEAAADILATLPDNTIACATNNLSLGKRALNLLQEVPDNPTRGMVAYIGHDYNSGWMNGDIRSALLSDIDTSVNRREYVNNGDFTTDNSGWSTANWTNNGDGTISATGSTQWMMQSCLPTNKQVTMKIRAKSASAGGSVSVYVGVNNPKSFTLTTSFQTFTWTTRVNSGVLYIYHSSGTNFPTVDSISVEIADQDRSVYGSLRNSSVQGAEIMGAVEKQPVASGAELVSYSNFTATDNYIRQDYNPSLNFGTGDFSFMGWFNMSYAVSQGLLSRVADGLGGTQSGWALNTASSGNLGWAIYTTGLHSPGRTNCGFSFYPQINTWHHFVGIRSGGRMFMYLNGVLDTGLMPYNSANLSDTTNLPELQIGKLANNSSPASSTRMALWRFSATAPSPEQVRKMYEDERHLFKDNAKATLYGNDELVTALSYDDQEGLLHAGTLAGRSVFNGLTRVDNTDYAVSAEISAVNGLVVEE